MAVLTEEAKVTLVQALACYDTPTQAAEAVAQEHGIKIERMQAWKYDPTKPAGKNLSKKLVDLFHATRAAFLKDTASIPVAQQAYRLRVLQKEVERAQARGNTAMVAQLLEQAAKESGGAFTNRRELTGANGGPIAQQTTTVTPEQLAEAVRSVREEF
jgi:hypothetical protein